MSNISRRDFVKSTAAAAAAMQLPSAFRAIGQTLPVSAPIREVELHWLDGGIPATSIGATWGVPWPRGSVQPGQPLALQTHSGESVPVQTWPLGHWPDGSLKWTAHAIPPDSGLTAKLRLAPGVAAIPAKPVAVHETDDAIEIDTGVMLCRVLKKGAVLIESIARDGKTILKNGRLVALSQDQPEFGNDGVLHQESFTGEIAAVKVEQSGPVRAVVKIDGKHRGGSNTREWLPFSVRLYFHAGGDSVRVMHTFIFDGDEQKDFIRGLGVRFDVVMQDKLLHDRHVRFAGEGRGVWAEGVRNLTGLRRDDKLAPLVKQRQLAGEACPPLDQFPNVVRDNLELIPAWGDYTLSQSGPDSFEIRKRTKPGCGWITADHGGRASGLGYIGGASGGVAFGLRDFWQRFPTQLDIRNAATDTAEVTLWMWSPDAPAMDLRFYHDEMGMETYEQQTKGLETTYEDYENGFGTPVGVARSSEITLWALAATPAREHFADMAAAVRVPPILACKPAHYLASGIFGPVWGLPDHSTPVKNRIEHQFDFYHSFYQKQIVQRHWYGFWNYGDVMHSYDRDRHVWRYDVGGFAWDNSELSPDLWLYYSYLRTGRADIFRMAEAMTHHTSEVDIYHLGRFAGLGTRHGVQHWGDSAKQVRISTSAYRRFYYFLTADERIGDIMRELVDADAKLTEIDAVRKLKNQADPGPYPARVSVGTDWCSFAANWLTEWERTGGAKYRDKLITGMKDIGAATHGFFSGDRFGYDPKTGHLYNMLGNKISASHLSAVFGMLEICSELVTLIDIPEFDKAFLQYCELYNASPEEKARALGEAIKDDGLRNAHSRLTAYAAWRKKSKTLAHRAWREFSSDLEKRPLASTHVEGSALLNPIDEAAGISTNDTAQWGLAAIQILALIGDSIPAQMH
jgi:hypothetical protein